MKPKKQIPLDPGKGWKLLLLADSINTGVFGHDQWNLDGKSWHPVDEPNLPIGLSVGQYCGAYFGILAVRRRIARAHSKDQ